MSNSCDLRRGLRSCGRAASGVCQYCGRTFCDDHGVRLDDGQEICSRSTCDQKRLDIIAFAEYKVLVATVNDGGACGHDGCSLAPTSECAKCRGQFCSAHVQVRDIEEHRAGRTLEKRATLCRHCDKRRNLWSKK
jgi:hypothetical protein